MSLMHGWFDTGLKERNLKQDTIHWTRLVIFILFHLSCLGVIWVGWSITAVFTALLLYFVRMFAITGFYHRYFSHKTFKTNRFWQFVFAALGNSALQRGPLWWASHHRIHHRYTEQSEDPHSPVRHGLLWSHVGWIFYSNNFKTDYNAIQDFAKYPELRLLNRFDTVVPIGVFFMLYLAGSFLANYYPKLHTTGMQLVIWGVISTTVLFHATFSINSLCHVWGKKTFETGDESRNNFLLALITMGEGWHNNHHYYQRSTSQGFRWWQIDITYYLLCFLEKIKVVHDLNRVPQELRKNNGGTNSLSGNRFNKINAK
ncbi:MAG: acyl-CoA desaturase [Legionella sp. 39-23]|nr:MAG: acyl-CoA desaturase [Legionella sp. 39-23]